MATRPMVLGGSAITAFLRIESLTKEDIEKAGLSLSMEKCMKVRRGQAHVEGFSDTGLTYVEDPCECDPETEHCPVCDEVGCEDAIIESRLARRRMGIAD